MRNQVEINAPAKVNLHLEVGGKRADGYHDILSLFQMVSLCDTIKIRSLTHTHTVHVRGMKLPPEQNLIVKAVEVFRSSYPFDIGLDIRVSKSIPMQAGLGGGSSDAAAVLRGLDLLLQTGLRETDFISISKKLGSDVPFFCCAPVAVVAGIGEKITPIKPRDDFRIVIIKPPIAIPTADAYGWMDFGRKGALTFPRYSKRKIISEYRKDPNEWQFTNTFTSVLNKRSSIFKNVLKLLRLCGASYTNISGSGSSVFGIFNSIPDTGALKQIIGGGMDFWVLYPLDRIPKAIVL